MSTKTIVCPSGLTGEIRNLKAKEMSILADPGNRVRTGGKKAKAAHPLDPIYAGCWLKTENPGPYGFAVGEPVPWGKVLVCDRFFMLLHIRDCTWGGYEFKVKCQNGSCKRHKKPFVWEIDINSLEYKPLPPESVEKVKAGNRTFKLQLAGKECQFKLLTGEDEANAPTLSEDVESHKKMLAIVASRIFMVQGIDSDDARVDWVGELDLPDLYKAQRMMDAVDGGVETRTTVQCPDCEEEFTVDIPFGDAAFLAPTPK
jgi:hypothetical protein